MALGSNNPFPSALLVEGSAPSSPSAGQQRIYIDSADHKFKRKNSSGTVTNLEGALSYSGVNWSSGTSMPGSPATNDRITRTDLGLDFYYDGTRWLTTTLYHLPMAGPMDGNTTAASNGWPNAVSPNTVSRVSLWHSDFAIWLVSFYGNTYTNATNNGTNYWTAALAGALTGTAYGSFNTSADTAATQTGHAAALNQVAGSTERGLTMTLTKTGTPGSVFAPTGVTYRLIGS